MDIVQFTHLDSEVEHIAPANLKAFKGDDMAKLLKKLQAHAKATVDSYTSVPFICRSAVPLVRILLPVV
jgi:hypothetical protein